MKILMVCLGNVCRSPLAEGILRSKLSSDNFLVDSAGTTDYHVGYKPDSRAIWVARENGIDISDLKSRLFTIQDFDNFDLIYAMDTVNYHDLLYKARNKADKEKVKLILNEIDNENRNVPDPYYGESEDFEKVYNLLNDVCGKIANRLKPEKSEKIESETKL